MTLTRDIHNHRWSNGRTTHGPDPETTHPTKTNRTKTRAMKLDLQFIDHPGNRERLVVLPEYQFRLLERAANARMYDLEHVNGIAMLPRAEQERVLAGENPIRVVREWRGLKGQQLADLAGISSSMLSQIETTGKTGSAKTFRTIAMVLGVPLELIFPKASDDGLE